MRRQQGLGLANTQPLKVASEQIEGVGIEQ
jgi:hypothetical protein